MIDIGFREFVRFRKPRQASNKLLLNNIFLIEQTPNKVVKHEKMGRAGSKQALKLPPLSTSLFLFSSNELSALFFFGISVLVFSHPKAYIYISTMIT